LVGLKVPGLRSNASTEKKKKKKKA
jgi:hypothetical protein